jgi:hypothetical protein
LVDFVVASMMWVSHFLVSSSNCGYEDDVAVVELGCYLLVDEENDWLGFASSIVPIMVD